MNRSQILWIYRLIGIIIFILIILRIDLSTAINIITGIDLTFLAVAILLLFPQMFLRALRWEIIMKNQNISIPLLNLILIYFVGLFVGIITPGKLGDFIKVIYLRDSGYSTGKSLVSVLIDRLFDMLVLFIIGGICLFGFLAFFSFDTRLIISLLVIFLLTPVITYFSIHFNKEFCIKFISSWVPFQNHESINKNIDDFFNDMALLNKRTVVICFGLTVITWFLYCVMGYYLALSLAIAISFTYLSACIIISSLITLIPISISGIGTRDATFIMFFSFIGINSEMAVAFSALILFMIFINGIIGLLAWLKMPISLWQKSN